MKNLILLIACTLALGSCKKTDCGNHHQAGSEDYYVFGVTGGLCGECYHYYKLENNALYRDSVLYPKLIFSSSPLPPNKYLLAKQLKDQFPAYMRNEPNKTYGCPGCADQRSFYMEIKQGTDTLRWRVDEFGNTQPAPIRPYMQQMGAILNQLQ